MVDIELGQLHSKVRYGDQEFKQQLWVEISIALSSREILTMST